MGLMMEDGLEDAAHLSQEIDVSISRTPLDGNKRKGQWNSNG